MFTRLATVFAAVLLFARPGDADQKWARIDTSNFIVIGTVGESRLRSVGTQFEGFREALTKLLSSTITSTAVPTVVIVFSDDKTFQEFKPVYNGKPVEIGGLFVPRQQINYILIGPPRSTDALRPVFHEYSHLLVNNVEPGLPVWLNEGLAEYYSSFDLENNGQYVTIGRTIESHYRTLASETWLPLKELLATKHDSPQYNENSRRGVFYAECWMLTHMLLHGEPDRRAQLRAYVGELSTGADPVEAWERQFGREDMMKALRAYSERRLIAATRYTMSDRITGAPGAAVSFAPADAEATLGELLVALRRNDDAIKHFDRALNLKPAFARAAVGRAFAAGERPAATVDSDSTDWLSEYMIGSTLLTGVGSMEQSSIASALAALERAARARGDIPNLQVLYARALEESGGDPSATVDALKKAHEAVPARDDYALLLAQALTRAGQYAGARAVLGDVMARPHLPGGKDAAFAAMRRTVAAEERANRGRGAAEEPSNANRPAPPSESSAVGGADATVHPAYRPVQPGERRVEGSLERIDCAPKRIELVVRLSDRVARFQATGFDKVDFISYRSDPLTTVTCGARQPPDHVYLTFTAGELDGAAVALEFLAKQ